MTVNNSNTDFYKYYAQPTDIYKKVNSYEKVFTKDLSNGDEYATKKPDNIAQKAIAAGKPESLPTKINDSVVDNNRSFQFKESVSSKDQTDLSKQVMQIIARDALISHAAIIRSSHETKGERKESAK